MKKYSIVVPFLAVMILSTVVQANYEKAAAPEAQDNLHKQGEAEDRSASADRQSVEQQAPAKPAGEQQPVAGRSGQPAQTRANAQQVQPKAAAKLDVAAQSQLPELYNGCEMTSLSMLLNYEGHFMDKLSLAGKIKKDPTPLVMGSDDNPISWGDPNNGFVGDVYGDNMGFAVYHGPVAQLLNQLLPGRAEDLSGRGFDAVLAAVADGRPAVVWTTAHFGLPGEWVTWKGPNGSVRATFEEHAVLLVGYDSNNVYVNDPFDGTKSKAVNRKSFEAAWKAMGSQAVTYTKQ